jgi:hypothetical protein
MTSAPSLVCIVQLRWTVPLPSRCVGPSRCVRPSRRCCVVSRRPIASPLRCSIIAVATPTPPPPSQSPLAQCLAPLRSVPQPFQPPSCQLILIVLLSFFFSSPDASVMMPNVVEFPKRPRSSYVVGRRGVYWCIGQCTIGWYGGGSESGYLTAFKLVSLSFVGRLSHPR